MYKLFKLPFAAIALLAFSLTVSAQRPRSVDESVKPKPAPAPKSVKAKYEGGIFGYKKKQEGTLSFDDENNRLVFHDKTGKEVLFIPYTAINQEFADTQANRPKSATILGSVPVPYGINPIGYIKTKNQYVTIQFYDEVGRVGGVTSFRVENKEICNSVVATLADKAGLVPRGDIFTKPSPEGPLASATSTGDRGSSSDPAERPAVFVENEALSNRVISLPRPVYPEEARQQKVGGVVRVLATVDETGSVAEAEAVSGSPMLQEAAVNAARQAKFEPLGRSGRPSKTKTIISYNFQLL
jgi:TonB family protein